MAPTYLYATILSMASFADGSIQISPCRFPLLPASSKGMPVGLTRNIAGWWGGLPEGMQIPLLPLKEKNGQKMFFPADSIHPAIWGISQESPQVSGGKPSEMCRITWENSTNLNWNGTG
jgi:hypothetical protein